MPILVVDLTGDDNDDEVTLLRTDDTRERHFRAESPTVYGEAIEHARQVAAAVAMAALVSQ